MIPEEKQREKRKYTKRAPKFFKNAMDDSQEAVINDVHAVEPLVTKVKISKKPVTTNSSVGKKVDWYAALPSVEELQQRAQAQATKSKNITKPYIETIDGRELVCLPFVDVGIPDVVEFNYPPEENPKIECPYPRAARYALKGIWWIL